jgi:hypothetical protein
VSEWQDISTAPKDGTAIWVLFDGRPYLGYCRPADPPLNESDMWFLKATFERKSDRRSPDKIYGVYAFDVHPTHWQPLPEPPTQGSDTI